jgi:hypothetical protein
VVQQPVNHIFLYSLNKGFAWPFFLLQHFLEFSHSLHKSRMLLLVRVQKRIGIIRLQLLFVREMDIGIIHQEVKRLNCSQLLRSHFTGIRQFIHSGDQFLMLGIDQTVSGSQRIVKYNCHINLFSSDRTAAFSSAGKQPSVFSCLLLCTAGISGHCLKQARIYCA